MGNILFEHCVKGRQVGMCVRVGCWKENKGEDTQYVQLNTCGQHQNFKWYPLQNMLDIGLLYTHMHTHTSMIYVESQIPLY